MQMHRSSAVVAPIVTLAAILVIYIVTAIALYPNLPITTRLAENQPGYATHYPPFRTDEFNYYQISLDILGGRLYHPDSYEYGYPLGFPVIAAPFVAVMGESGGYAANILVTWLCAVMFFLLASRFVSTGKALAMTVVLAFAVLNWFYAISWYSEPLAQLLVLTSCYLLTIPANTPKRHIALAGSGLLLALVLFVRPHYILLAAPFFAYLAIRDRSLRIDRPPLLFACGVVAIILLWMVRNALMFGGPFTFEYTRHLGDYIPGAHSSYIKGNIFLGTHLLLFDQYHGLLTITPILLLFPAGLRKMWLAGKQRESLLLLASVIIMALFAASSTYPFTEFGLGSRHMVPVIPLMLLPTVFLLDWKVFSTSLVTVLVAYSFYHAGIGWFTGGEPGRGFFLGILNEAQSRAVILSRKDMLPIRTFGSRDELVAVFRDALDDTDMYRFLQTLAPDFRRSITGHERELMIFLRNQADPASFIDSVDPAHGIIIRTQSGESGNGSSNSP